MAFDSTRGVVVLFGGYLGAGPNTLNDTWEWDGQSWTERHPVHQPSGTNTHAMAYDVRRQRTVLFGNVAEDPVTWEWDGTDWTQALPPVTPPGRRGPALAYDPVRSRIVLFGGERAGVPFSDTWEWDGQTWTQLVSPQNPAARIYHGMTYDSERSKAVLAGGDYASETWQRVGTAWSQPAPALSPAPRGLTAVAFDELLGETVMFGGRLAGTSTRLDDTWTWNGSAWTQQSPVLSPSARYWHAVAYDRHRSRLVLFGGDGENAFSDTWELISPVAAYTAFGQACAGSAGLPVLTATPPRIGNQFDIQLAGLPINSQAVLLLGLSNTFWWPAQLPLQLNPIGLTNCYLLVSAEFSLPFATGNGAPLLSVLIPPDQNLFQFVFFNQAFIIDPTANPGGITSTNGGRGRIGI